MAQVGSQGLVLRDDDGAVCTLTLNRPEKRNAINEALFRELGRHIEDLNAQSGDIGCIVLRGAGGTFCAGHDLSELPHPDGLDWLKVEMQTLEQLTQLRQPVIAEVQGYCFTGGLEMALAADFIIAGESAQFADTHGKWGLVPGWGLSQRLPRRVGQAKALEMMLTCRLYTGAQAEAMGLANECVPDASLGARVQEIAREIVANSWHSNAANKKLIYETDGFTLGQGLSHELLRSPGMAKDAVALMDKFKKK